LSFQNLREKKSVDPKSASGSSAIECLHQITSSKLRDNRPKQSKNFAPFRSGKQTNHLLMMGFYFKNCLVAEPGLRAHGRELSLFSTHFGSADLNALPFAASELLLDPPPQDILPIDVLCPTQSLLVDRPPLPTLPGNAGGMTSEPGEGAKLPRSQVTRKSSKSAFARRSSQRPLHLRSNVFTLWTGF
jgi:hypothetical protein